MTLPEAAGVLHLPVASVEALVGAGYLRPSADHADGPRFALGDLKAFLARNVDVDDGAADVSLVEAGLDDLDSLDDLDPESLFAALDDRAGSMARRALDLFVTFFPEASAWAPSQQARFIEDAKARFEAILAVASLGDDVDEMLMAELESVGAEAADFAAYIARSAFFRIWSRSSPCSGSPAISSCRPPWRWRRSGGGTGGSRCRSCSPACFRRSIA